MEANQSLQPGNWLQLGKTWGRYLVGIDLGTTNSALSYFASTFVAASVMDGPKSTRLPFRNWSPSASASQSSALLPSLSCTFKARNDLPPAALALPWDTQAAFAVGEFARQHGSRIPGRQVTSAKSWLSHSGVDRTAKLLP